MTKISIEGLDKADVLAALYNHARPLGMGFLHYTKADMMKEEAKDILDGGYTNFDYLFGRVMKVDLSGNEFDTSPYNRDNGEGSAEEIVKKLRI